MSLLLRASISPLLWLLCFASVYALHGVGCAKGWYAIETILGSLHHVVMMSTFVLGLFGTGLALHYVPREAGFAGDLLRIAGWIGFGATLLTLFPVLVLTTCS